MIGHTLSESANQMLATWSAMDTLRFSNANSADWNLDLPITPVIDGPLHRCDACGGQGFISNTWDSSSQFHPCYACSTSGVTTYDAYAERVWHESQRDMRGIVVCANSVNMSWCNDYDLDNGGY